MSEKNQNGTDKKRTELSHVTITGGRPGLVRRRTVEITEKKETPRTKRSLEKERREMDWSRGVVRVKTGMDRYLLMLILLLVALGLITLFSASYPISIYETSGSDGGPTGTAYITRQLLFAAVGVGVMFGISFIPYNFYRKFGFVFYAVVLLLLVAAMFVGHGGTDAASDNGVKRWIGIKGTPFNIQPSELMKSALVMVLAKYYEKRRDTVVDYTDRTRSFLWGVIVPYGIIAASAFPVIVGKHLSGTMIVAMIGVCVMFIGGAHFLKTMITGLIGLSLAGIYYVSTQPYALKRITTFFDPNADALSENWQTTQGLYAIGSGGPLGKGFGNSDQKYSFVSDAHTDFIFTIWGEEMGFVGAVLLIGIFLLFIFRGFTIAKNAPDNFSCLLASGITFKIGVQVVLNIAVVTNSFFNTGVPLPFFSYGGSSLLVLMAELGILLSISRHSYQKRL